ncbi:FAD:protein FMN transferase [Massilia agilis]|uniref:FAD:protein FMN transferase n=1 Tax=Massilia agilis TaxID=1811226 RepID=A0ABT2DF82_9BURK|nr:FAD:protein FMN transferase [Massilia agilis]MCS0809494.1 FAD:protein FMN transferase [Massilia agilis]
MIRRAQPWLGTMVEVTIPDAHDLAAADAAFAEVARVHRLMSFHDAASDVSRVNRADPGDAVEVDADTWQVLRIAQELAELSGGAFDIACAPRLVAWEVLPPPAPARPQARPVQEVIALEEGKRVRKLAAGWIDLGGIAKGYAVDVAVAALRQAGMASGCVNAGGDLRVFGPSPMPVAVRSPAAPGQAASRIMLADEALATSASYFSRRSSGGRQVSALVDARDGRALVADRSASVRAPRCVLADALAKVVLATGDATHPALQACGASAFLV